ncbi:MAG TPA: ECF-type sigma factor [Steroidobacteraceae bacterium]|nr:ECF-type sigma factor [Steroidobacteraceae bacterium]
MSEVTRLLQAARIDKIDPTDRLFGLLYGDLRSLARRQLRRQDHARSLDTTVIVHESYFRLRNRGVLGLEDRNHFLAYAARVMRAVIVDLARSRLAEKRGGNQVVTLRTSIVEAANASDDDVVRLNEALEELAKIEPRLARLVELRYFGGLSESEAAEALGVAKRTAQRDWEKARLFLFATLQSGA